MSLFLLLLLLLLIFIYESRSCPTSPYFDCPDDVYNGTLSSFGDDCWPFCVLTCNHNRTIISCRDSLSYPVLQIDPNSNGTLVVEYPDFAALDHQVQIFSSHSPCQAYGYLGETFPHLSSLKILGGNDTFLGCPYPSQQVRDEMLDIKNQTCDDSMLIVYGPFELPPKQIPLHCIQFQTFRLSDKDTHRGRRGSMLLLLEIALPSIGILGFIIIICFRERRKKSKELSTFAIRNHLKNQNVEDFLNRYGCFAIKRYNYSDIKKMTNSFKEKLGQGGFGTVYKGKSIDGCLVAVKLLKQSKEDNGEFINEVASIGRTNHVNIVTLLGFCFEGKNRALVYEFMVNGSLEKFTIDASHNVGKMSLTWQTMFDMSLGIARGLEYLHRGCQTRILHFDIKPHNILLDENYCPKISDFGLAKLYPQSKESKVSMSVARGTVGYIAPEVFCRTFGEVSHKSDVYSYGMMVLEVIGSRKRANDGTGTSSSEMYFPRWIYRQMDRGEDDDEIVMSDEGKEVKRKLILVSLWCIQTFPSSRPSMSKVVQMLEAEVETIEVPPMPTLSSPPRTNLYPSDIGSFSITL